MRPAPPEAQGLPSSPPGGTHAEGHLAPVLVAPLRLELLAVLTARPGLSTRRCGMGPLRAERAAGRLDAELVPGRPVVVTGVCGGLTESARPGEVVVAANVLVETGRAFVPDPQLTAAVLQALSDREIAARLGTVVSVRRPAWGARRSRLASRGGDVVDTETGYLLGVLGRRPVAVVRVVSDVPGAGFRALPRSGLAALRTLAKVAGALGRSDLRSGTTFATEHISGSASRHA